MAIDFYGYKRCDTCRKAEKHLTGKGIDYRFIDITEEPPPRAQLQRALQMGYRLADLFNRSGVAYREQNMKERLKTLSEDDALDLLASQGRLCKRPFVFDAKRLTVGFQQETFSETWTG